MAAKLQRIERELRELAGFAEHGGKVERGSRPRTGSERQARAASLPLRSGGGGA